ncbi:hypothetical protein GCM10010277_69540 [Streptomyces longisporoflavus]|nr:hypothetical protein [Streptomyces longisporoflavus]GGV63388.1 hypothetical protein GCM10010277_69540 [Streptomyces longisporoflavus]
MPQMSKVELYAAIRRDHRCGAIIETGTDSYCLARARAEATAKSS